MDYSRPRMERQSNPWVTLLRGFLWALVGIMLAFCLVGAVVLFTPLPA